MISGRLSEDDVLAAQRLHRRRSARGVTTVLPVVALVGIVVPYAASRAIGLGLLFAGPTA